MTDTDDARAVLSEMIEITEQTIEQTFHRHADLDTLYRECPTAFWLAPDGDAALPAPPPGPVMPCSLPKTMEDAATDAPVAHGLSGGIVRALLVAGPIFSATALMLSRPALDEHWWDPIGRALVSLVAAPLTITIGALLALLPVLLGVLTLGTLGATTPVVRHRAAWALVGGMMGVAIAALVGADGPTGLALIVTSIACASIARAAVDWTDPDFA